MLCFFLAVDFRLAWGEAEFRWVDLRFELAVDLDLAFVLDFVLVVLFLAFFFVALGLALFLVFDFFRFEFADPSRDGADLRVLFLRVSGWLSVADFFLVEVRRFDFRWVRD